jgi:glycerol uptake facilitator-like aquaporin
MRDAIIAAISGLGTPQTSPKLDLSIEGMRSQEFSEAVFAFLLVGIAVFSVIVVVFWYSRNRPQEARFGEKMMFASIVMGVAVAVVFGALQMLGGVLF